MNATGKTAIFLGISLISGILFGILSSVPALETPEYLTTLPGIETQVLLAIFSQAAMAIAYVCIAAMFYPIVKQYSENLAVLYFGFRIVGAGFLFVGIGSLLLLLWLSQHFAQADPVNPSFFPIVAELLRRGRDILNHIGMILPWSIGGMILYYCLYKIRIIPRWLSVWGLLGSTLTFIATLLLMLNFIRIVEPIYFLLNTPTALFEIVLALTLMFRGFDSIEASPTRLR